MENVFGILVARFQVFQKLFNLKLVSIEKVVIVCCVLHNFDEDRTHTGLRATNNNVSVPDLQRGTNRRTSPDAIASRDAFLQCFNNEGAGAIHEELDNGKFSWAAELRERRSRGIIRNNVTRTDTKPNESSAFVN
ncbi:hypothetical protein HHI36_020855, partial [Cryptolaemus montrouzieri]